MRLGLARSYDIRNHAVSNTREDAKTWYSWAYVCQHIRSLRLSKDERSPFEDLPMNVPLLMLGSAQNSSFPRKRVSMFVGTALRRRTPLSPGNEFPG